MLTVKVKIIRWARSGNPKGAGASQFRRGWQLKRIGYVTWGNACQVRSFHDFGICWTTCSTCASSIVTISRAMRPSSFPT